MSELKDMTKGSPYKLLISFALPMFLGNIFQQIYNLVDTVVVGKFVGKEALAAVGSSFAIMLLINSVIMGLTMGASVLFSQLYGSGEYKKLKVSIIMAAFLILSVTLLISSIAFFATDLINKLYRMPEETTGYARDYLRWIFAGLFFVSLYNLAANILRSLGDSKTLLYFLLLASVINIVLDLLFVIKYGLEVKGVAIATVIAQAVSAILCVLVTARKLSYLSFKKEDFTYDRILFKTMTKYAFLTGIQQSIMNFGIVMIQGLVNTFGTSLMAAFAAGVKVDAFAYIPLQDFGNAFAIYTAQNIGANKGERVREGLRAAAIIIGVFGIFISLVVILAAENLIGLFVKASELDVIAIGANYLRIEGAFYVLIGFLFMFYGFYRGLGKAGMSIVLTVVSLGSRVLISYGLVASLGYSIIFWAIPLGWLLADVTGLLYWKYLNK
ncbi:MAG: MATE family efflux transporter [Deltaproteobacteria bacterium]|jgi:putative MATE family efflux protein|nr:MATE family efflux transporter [Deltaproteobacteria bacterium]